MMRFPSIRLAIVLGASVLCAVLAAAQLRAQPASMGPMGTPLPAPDEKIQEVADAKARFQQGDFPGALELLREAVKKNPDRLPPAQYIMALWYSQIPQGRGASLALVSIERAIVEDPDDPEAYAFLGNVEFQQGRVTAASLLFDKAHALAQKFDKSPSRKKAFEPRIYGGLAAVAESRAVLLGDDKERAKVEWITAQKHLGSWLTLERDDEQRAVALQRLARALFKHGTLVRTEDKAKANEEMTEALNKLKDAKTADPSVLTPHATMAKFYQEEDDFGKAKEFMEYALKIAPNDLRTTLEAAQWCLQTSLLEAGQLEQAREHAAKALRLDPKSLQARILRGVVALYQKDYKRAEDFFLAALVDFPSSFAASNNLALAYCEQDDASKKRRARDYAVDNARQHQQDRFGPEAASTYGWVMYKLGQVDEADRVLRQLVRSARVNEDTLYYAARVATDSRLGDRRRPEEARRLLDRALGTNRPFSMRPEAQLLLEELKKTGSGSR